MICCLGCKLISLCSCLICYWNNNVFIDKLLSHLQCPFPFESHSQSHSQLVSTDKKKCKFFTWLSDVLRGMSNMQRGATEAMFEKKKNKNQVTGNGKRLQMMDTHCCCGHTTLANANANAIYLILAIVYLDSQSAGICGTVVHPAGGTWCSLNAAC